MRTAPQRTGIPTLTLELTQARTASTNASDRSAVNVDGGTDAAAVLTIDHATWRLAVKRGLDIAASLALSILFLPIGLLIALLIKATSPGPVFFRQERVGKNGSTFEVVKFRTMVDGADRQLKADPEDYARYVANDFKVAASDPSITGLGRFLRATSLDELPQLLNILVGTMSLVGVRPVERAQLECRSQSLQARYVMMRPGLTGDCCRFG